MHVENIYFMFLFLSLLFISLDFLRVFSILFLFFLSLYSFLFFSMPTERRCQKNYYLYCHKCRAKKIKHNFSDTSATVKVKIYCINMYYIKNITKFLQEEKNNKNIFCWIWHKQSFFHIFKILLNLNWSEKLKFRKKKQWNKK